MATENDEESLSGSGSGDGDGSTRSRGPAVPTVNLAKALDLMRVIWFEEKRNSAPVSSILTHWDYKPKSSGGLQAIASLKRFGLLDEQGSGEKRTLKLSQLALDILKNESVDAAEYTRLLKEAALNPKFHRLLWEKHGAEMPSEQTMEKSFVFDLRFSEKAAKHFVKEYKDTLAFAKLVGGDTVEELADDLFEPATSRKDRVPPPSSIPPVGQAVASTPQAGVAVPGTPTLSTSKQLRMDLDSGPVVVNYPMSEEDFDLMVNTLNVWKTKLVKQPVRHSYADNFFGFPLTPKAHTFPAQAVWRNKDHDIPVIIVGEMGEQGGVKYFKSQSGTGIPENELTFA